MTQQMYFLAADKNGNYDLWVTDGTTTTAVGGLGDIGVSGASNQGLGPAYLTVFGQQMIFGGADALDNTNANGLWLTDGTAGGTTEVGGVSPGPGKSSPFTFGDPSGLNPTGFVAFGAKALFFGSDSSGFTGLWSTDGTVGNTIELGGLANGQIVGRGTNWDPTNFYAFGNQVVFRAYDSSSGGASYIGMWVTDGTTGGTVEVGGSENAAIFDSNATQFAPNNGLAFGDSLLFTAQNKAGDDALWITDGTAAGTVEIGGVDNAGVVGANNTGLGADFANAVDFGARVVFSGQDSGNSNGLWTTDATALGTTEVGGVGDAGLTAFGQHPSSLGLTPTQITNNGQDVLFNGVDALALNELWVTDGTALGTREIGGEGVGGPLANEAVDGLNPQNIVSIGNGKAVFIGYDRSNNQNAGKATLWVTDGTYAGTQEIGGLENQGVSGVNSGGFSFTSGVVGGSGLAYFVGEDAAGNFVLWETDGTLGGTKVVADTNSLAPVTGIGATDMTMGPVPAAVSQISGAGQTVDLNSIPGETVTLSNTNGVADTVNGSNGVVNLSSAQAAIIGAGVLVTLTGVCTAILSGTNGVKDTVFGSKGAVTLNNAQANVVGGKNSVTFASGTTGDVVYLEDTNGNWDSVSGAGGVIYMTSAQASVTGGGDKIYFEGGTGDQVSLYSTGGVWDTVNGSGGHVILNGAQSSIVGGGDSIVETAGSAASLYNTKGNWDSVTATSAQVILNGVQASISGGGNAISASAGSVASLYNTGYNFDSVSGSGLSVTLNGAWTSVVGGNNAITATAGSQASLYSTGGKWDTLKATGAKLIFNGAQASVLGGGNAIYLLGSGANFVSLYNTNGSQDTVTGSNAQMILNGVQVSVVGGGDKITATAGSTASLYSTGGNFDTVTASSALTILNGAQASIVGGGDTITATSGSTASLYGTKGSWDKVNASGAYVVLNASQASILGGANQITATSGSTASLYNTGGNADVVKGSGFAMVLNGAQATLAGDNDTVSFAGSSALSVSGTGERFLFGQTLGTSSIAGFVSSDVIQLSKLDWASYSALLSSGDLTQTAAGAQIRLDASDTITLAGVQAASLTSAQFNFA
jgi:ELWxxDGT repeat protein